MPSFLPFKALRPRNDLIEAVSAKSTDFKSKKELSVALKSNPLSFHHVTKNHLNYSGAYQEPEKFLPFAAKFLEDRIADGTLIQDQTEGYYIYHQRRMDGAEFKGLIGVYNVSDYADNKIKKHEEVRPNKINFVTQLMRSTQVMGEPILLGYKSNEKLSTKTAKKLVSFKSVDGKEHTISVINDSKTIEDIKQRMMEVDSFYIADGHHRAESVYNFHKLYPTVLNSQCMALLMDEDEFEMKPFHRLIRNIEPISDDSFFEKLNAQFDVEKIDKPLYTPQNSCEIGMYKDRQWFKLRFKQETDKNDIDLLETHVVRSIFKIEDSRTDSQISFHPETAGLPKLVKLINSGTFKYAFTLKPCSFEDVRRTSDRGEIMPPKSTFIEPKLRAGMVIKRF